MNTLNLTGPWRKHAFHRLPLIGSMELPFCSKFQVGFGKNAISEFSEMRNALPQNVEAT